MEEKEEKTFTKKDLKQQVLSKKLEEKQKKIEEKAAIKEEKERRKNSFGRKVRNFFLTIIFVIILVVVGFFVGKQFLTKKEKELANEKMLQTYQTALTFLENKDYKKAIELFNTITEDFDKYPEVSKKLKEVEQLYLNEYLSNSEKYLIDKKYDRALEILEGVEQEFQNSQLIINKKADIHIAKIKDEVAKLKEENKSKEILEYLAEYDDNNLDDVKDEIESLISQYKGDAILEARELLETNYSEAKKLIEDLQKVLPDDKDIKQLVEELKNVKTTNLIEQEEISRTRLYSSANSTIKDKDGNSYKGYIKAFLTSDSGNVTYNLGKKYSTLYGKICIPEDQEKVVAEGEPKVNIYNGDTLIYSSDTITYDTKAIDFSVDVSDIEEIKIEIVTQKALEIVIAEPTLIEK